MKTEVEFKAVSRTNGLELLTHLASRVRAAPARDQNLEHATKKACILSEHVTKSSNENEG